jgi:hypothetical protein
VTIIAGRTAPTKLMHLSAHATELLELSWSLQHGQQGMSALPDIDISTGIIETSVPPVAGTMAIARAISTTRTLWTKSMCEYYRAVKARGQQPPTWFGLVASPPVTDVHCGSVATEPFAAKIRRCPFRADSDHQPSKRDPSFCANGRKNFPPPPTHSRLPRFCLEFPLIGMANLAC